MVISHQTESDRTHQRDVGVRSGEFSHIKMNILVTGYTATYRVRWTLKTVLIWLNTLLEMVHWWATYRKFTKSTTKLSRRTVRNVRTVCTCTVHCSLNGRMWYLSTCYFIANFFVRILHFSLCSFLHTTPSPYMYLIKTDPYISTPKLT